MARYKVWAITLCYNEPSVIETSIRQYRATSRDDVETVHVLVDQSWPVGDALGRAARLKALASEVNGVYLDPGRNLGLAKGFNWAAAQFPIPDNAMLIGYDGDSWPVTPGWDGAMADLFVQRLDVAWFTLWHPHADRELLAERRGTDLGDGTVQVNSPCINSVCGWRMGWFRKSGGIQELQPFYGGLEVHTFKKLEGWKWIFLKNFREDYWPYPEMLNPHYRTWKHVTNHGGEKQIEFGDWLKLKGLV